jgi:hypothetical protein
VNLTHIQPSLPSRSTQQVGGRIDLRLSEPAAPGDATRPESAPPADGARIGTIEGVLTAEENRAIASLFGEDSGAYTARGAMARQGVPGLNLDLRA